MQTSLKMAAWIVLVPLAVSAVAAPATSLGPGGETACWLLLIAGNDSLWNDFWDYGDAPDSSPPGTFPQYPTYYVGGGNLFGYFPTLSDTFNSNPSGQPGARHHVTGAAWLGDVDDYSGLGTFPLALGDVPSSPEADADTPPDADGLPTNLDPGTLTPDHDGHDNGLYPAALSVNGNAVLDFRVSAAVTITRWYVNVLIDWDFNGRWTGFDPNGAPEWAVQNFLVSVPAGQSSTFSDVIQTGSTLGEPWTRITLTPGPITAPATGWDGSVPPGVLDFFGRPAFPCGETEDYCGRLVVKGAIGTESPGEKVTCDPPSPVEDPCRDAVSSYNVDLSTGTDLPFVANSWYDRDLDWTVTSIPGNANPPPDVYSLKPHPAWAVPGQANWVNPFGNQYYGVWSYDLHDYGNNWWNPPLGDYVYEIDFPVSPQATGVLFDFKWWRDDATLSTSPFEYDDEVNGWTPLGFGTGFQTNDASTVYYLDVPPNSNTGQYHLRVTVNNAQTFTGLLVEGKATVYCGPLP